MGDKPQMGVAMVLKGLVGLILGAATLFGLYHGFNQYIDTRIHAKLSNASFLRELARSIRPSVVFDENESIIADIGAMTYLESIAVTKVDKETLKIVVEPKEYIGIEPILEALDEAYVIKAERGSGCDWIFQLKSAQVAVFGGPKERRPERFRLELIR